MYYKLYYTKVKFGQFWKNWFGTRTEEKQWHALPTALDESLKKKKTPNKKSTPKSFFVGNSIKNLEMEKPSAQQQSWTLDWIEVNWSSSYPTSGFSK